METNQLRLYHLAWSEARTYLLTALFVIGNVLLPQLCHLVPNGGHTWLPIYFFTLIAAYKYGWKAGLMVAIASPLVNNLLFGMPAAGALTAIWAKSGLLALTAAVAAAYFKRVSVLILLGVVLAYQIVGGVVESIAAADWNAGLADFRMGLPGMALQVIGGWAVLRYMLKG